MIVKNVTKASLVGALALFLALAFLLFLPGIARADLPDPETLEVEAARVFRHMLEADDILLVARYNAHYANITVQPAQCVDQTFDFTWYDSSSTLISNTTAYGYHNQGYGKGCVAFYLAANATTMPTWGDLGNITVRGTSLFDAPAPEANYTLKASDYSSYSSPADIREDFRQYVIANSLFLELDWNEFWADLGMEWQMVSLTMEMAGFTVLSNRGEAYWGQVIDSLRDICPLLFALEALEPSYTDEEHPQTQATTYEQRYADTPVEDFKVGLSDFFGGIGTQTVGTIFVVIFMMVVAGFYAFKWQKPIVGILGAFPGVLIFTIIGLPEMAIVFLMVAMAFLTVIMSLFFKPGAG